MAGSAALLAQWWPNTPLRNSGREEARVLKNYLIIILVALYRNFSRICSNIDLDLAWLLAFLLCLQTSPLILLISLLISLLLLLLLLRYNQLRKIRLQWIRLWSALNSFSYLAGLLNGLTNGLLLREGEGFTYMSQVPAMV